MSVSYRFGPNLPKCADEKEWKRLSGAIVWVDIDEYREIVPIKCPNCGATNSHVRNDIAPFSHNECVALHTDIDGNTIKYECPGYIIMWYFP